MLHMILFQYKINSCWGFLGCWQLIWSRYKCVHFEISSSCIIYDLYDFCIYYILIKLKKLLLKSEETYPLFSFKEMIIDKVNGQAVPRYLIYDIIKFNVSTFYNL